MKVYLIGENNPYSSDPRHALYPHPRNSAGGRLCHEILLMDQADYVRSFERRNLLNSAKWSAPEARRAAKIIATGTMPDDRLVLLGRKVFDAFAHLELDLGGKWEPFDRRGRYLLFPHPSGLCRIWNDPEAMPAAREALRQFAPHLAGIVRRAS